MPAWTLETEHQLFFSIIRTHVVGSIEWAKVIADMEGNYSKEGCRYVQNQICYNSRKPLLAKVAHAKSPASIVILFSLLIVICDGVYMRVYLFAFVATTTGKTSRMWAPIFKSK